MEKDGVKILLEREIESYLNENVKKRGGRSYKFMSPGNSGVPDRIVVFPGGRVVFVELKTETGRLSALQVAQIRRLERLGADVRVLYGLDDVKEFLDGFA